jgi:hypothetical protein
MAQANKPKRQARISPTTRHIMRAGGLDQPTHTVDDLRAFYLAKVAHLCTFFRPSQVANVFPDTLAPPRPRVPGHSLWAAICIGKSASQAMSSGCTLFQSLARQTFWSVLSTPYP